MTRRGAALAACLAVAGSSRAACRPETGAWTDPLTDYGCVATRRNAKLSASGGVTIDPGLLTWSWPADARFSSGTVEPTLEVHGRGSTGETVSLWQRVYEPGAPLQPAVFCAPIGVSPCPASTTTPPAPGKADGVVHPAALTGCPGYAPSAAAPAAGWDTMPGALVCAGGGGAAGVYGGLTPFNGTPVLAGGGAQGLAVGRAYAASFTASANHDGSPTPYLEFAVANRTTNTVAATWTMNEDQLALPFATGFPGLTRASVGFAPTAGPAVWDVRAIARTGDSHCTLLGPVWLTAQDGAVTTPAFDSLSDSTAWQKIEWEADQNATAADPACACPTPGSPITPVTVAWGIGASPSVSPATPVAPVPLPDAGEEAVPGAVTGRYLAIRATLHGREKAALVAPLLDVTDPHLHFAGWRPVVKRLAVRYFARAAQVVSRPVAPPSLKAWGQVTWDAETPGGSKVAVDVLDAAGAVLFADIPREVTLTASLDPFTWPALTLRARLECDPADPAVRPVFRGWRVTWTPQPGRLTLNRNAIRGTGGEVVNGLVALEREGHVRVRVHDAAGRTVAMLVDGWYPAATVAFSWNGRARDGAAVAPGPYFVSCTTPGGAGTRKLAVLR